MTNDTTGTPRPEIRDPHFDEMIADHREAYPDEDYWTTRCSDVSAHRATFDGARVYLRRVELNMTRADIEDKLLDQGIDVTVATIESWEHGLYEANARDVPEIGVAAFLALPRVLGGALGDFVCCWTCNRAAHPERFPDEQETARRADYGVIARELAKRFIAARDYLELTRDAAAVRAGITPREAELLERGKGCVSINAVLAYHSALGVTIPAWMLAFTDSDDEEDEGGEDEPAPEFTPDGGVGVETKELVAAA